MRLHQGVYHVLLTGFLCVPPPLVLAADFSGPVISVVDGDTIEVLHKTRAERVRLHGIDCPEKGQAYGNRTKQAASALVFGKEVTLQTYGKDKYGRTLAALRSVHSSQPCDGETSMSSCLS